MRKASTFTDSVTRKLNLELEINALKSLKESAARELKETQDSFNDVLDRREILDRECKEIEDAISRLGDEMSNILAERLEAIRSANIMVSEYLEELKKMDMRIGVKKEELEELDTKKNTYHREMLMESERLAAQQKDLQIYKDRIEKMRDEVAPDMKITLQ